MEEEHGNHYVGFSGAKEDAGCLNVSAPGMENQMENNIENANRTASTQELASIS